MKTKLLIISALISSMAVASQSNLTTPEIIYQLTVHDSTLLPGHGQDHLQLELATDSFSLGGFRPANTSPLSVTIKGPDNNIWLQTSTQDTWVDFLLDASMPDGLYRYEASYSSPLVVDSMISDDETPTRAVRAYGTFRVNMGVIIDSNDTSHQLRVKEPQLQHPNAHRQSNNILLHGVVSIFSRLTPTAQAQDLVSTGPVPQVRFDDTQDEDCSPDGDWLIIADGGDSDTSTNNIFQVLAAREETPCSPPSQGFYNRKLVIFDDGDGDNTDSFKAFNNGDVWLQNGTVMIDKSSGFMGIGTTMPAEELEIQSTNPRIWLDDSGFSVDYSLGETAGDFTIEIEQSQLTGGAALVGAKVFTIDGSTGYVGIHDSSPDAPLNVQSRDGQSAKILVENTTTTPAPRTLFELSNEGNTKFEINNTDASVSWAFANPGSGFRVSRQGSGVVEFDLLNNGNLTIAGTLTENSDRNAKTHIVPIDNHAILQKVAKLPIQQWQYKDALGENHIGPMAQDFYAAFGLGATDKGIATLDSAGVALVAIQALLEQNQQQAQRIDKLEARLVQQQQTLTDLNRRLARQPLLSTSTLTMSKAYKQ